MASNKATAATSQTWDAIVIGSGIGGLTFAAIYSQLARKRVLILERHYVPGGFTHSFERKGFRWDVGLHYVGSMAPGSPSRRLMDLVTGGQVGWQPLPDGYDVYHYPRLRLTAHSSPQQYAASLIAAFPEHGAEIQRYFEDVTMTAHALGPQIWSWSLPGWISAPLRWLNRRAAELSTITVAEYLRRHVTNPRLAAALSSHWGDYGLPPEQASFGTHALITASYFGGAYFPVGGGEQIAKAALAVVREHGGECLINTTVDRILTQNGVATGVSVGAQRYQAPLVISNAGAATTFGRLLPSSATSTSLVGPTAITLYLGLRESPETLGVLGENHWVHENFQHRVSSEINSAFVSFSSLNNPQSRRHTVQVMAIVTPELFEPWLGTHWKQRGPEYERRKEILAARLLSLADKAIPGLSSLVEYQELSTPLTVEHFTGSTSIYGSPGTPQRFRERSLRVRTPVRNLLLTGADACCLGIQGAMMGGVFAAAYAIHPITGLPQVMRASKGARPGN